MNGKAGGAEEISICTNAVDDLIRDTTSSSKRADSSVPLNQSDCVTRVCYAITAHGCVEEARRLREGEPDYIIEACIRRNAIRVTGTIDSLTSER